MDSTSGERASDLPRLLIVAPSAELYGSDRSLLLLLPHLVERFDVFIAAPAEGPLVERCRSLGVHVEVLADFAIRRRHLTPLAMIPWLVRIVGAVRTLSREHRSRPFALIYSGTLASGIGSLLRGRWGIPHVQHIREFPHHGVVQRNLLLRWVARTADFVICNSRYIRDACVEVAPSLAPKSVVVHNGVDPDVESVPIRAGDGPLRVVCAGRISAAKGQTVLVEAARLAIQQGANWTLDFYGDALAEDREVEERLRSQVDAAGLSSLTTFHGFDPDQDAVYASADVVIVPSVVPEPFGRTVIEAQIRGIPVVASQPGGPAEIIVDSQTGHLFPIGDSVALAAAIRSLEDVGERSRIGEAGRARALDHFTTDAYAHAAVRVLCDALGDTRPSVLVVSPSAELYGADRVLLSVLPSLNESFDLTVAVPGPGSLIGELSAAGVETVVLPDYAIRSRHLRPAALPQWLGRVVRSMFALGRLHRRERFDLVYSVTLASGIGSFLSVQWRKPHVQHVHEIAYHGVIRRQLLLRWAHLTSKRVIFNSRFARDVSQRAVGALANKATVVPNGIGRCEPVGDQPASSERLRVVCAARINHLKGHSVLIEAARLAALRGSQWELHFFGDALPEDAAIARGLHDQVDAADLAEVTVFHGFVEDQGRIYEAADVVVVPSTLPETFGLTALEAHARGVPVVATVPGGPAEIVEDGETGYLVPAGDPASLSAAISKLEDPELRASLGAKAIDRARREFPIDETASGLVDNLRSALSSLR